MVIVGKRPRNEIKQLSDEELEAYLHLATEGSSGSRLATEELNHRRPRSAAKSAWSLTLRVYLLIIAIISVAIVAIPLVRWLY
jgi:hypothetical protein